MAVKTKKKPVWRKSDQTNADLPIGRTWIDNEGSLIELVVTYIHVVGQRDKVWIAHPFGWYPYSITSDGPGNVVRAWDRKVSYEREKARLEPNCADNF